MKVIFIKDLKKQGKINEVKEVSDGYATNYLIKNGYAVKYTKTSSSILDKDLKNKQKEEEKAILKAQELAKALENITLKFNVKCNKGKVFGSISNKQIQIALKEKGIEIDKKIIKNNEALNTLGVHNVELNLHKKVKGILKVQLIEK